MTGRAHTNPAMLMGMLDEQPTEVERSSIRILPDFNPRLPLPGEADPFSDDALADLTASIAEQGILQPILVRPAARGTYELIAGERRYRAAGLAGLQTVPVLVRELTDEQARLAALTENGQRRALPYAQEALLGMRDIARLTGSDMNAVPALLNRLKNGADDEHGVARYLQVTFGETVSTWAQRRALVLKLTPDEHRALNAREVTLSTVQPLTRLGTRPERAKLLQQAIRGELTADAVAARVQDLLKPLPARQQTVPVDRLRRALPDLGRLKGQDAKRADALIQELLSLLPQDS
ncbi:ParB/RepB/Spo0J family partition protein [Deinococcus aquiradiocola]|uniref:Chromosome partitioning protein ParB n=1 Tax=Deinococcus aquiradiocola TaxID=393059 RepID=A0A917PA54_9DEIO|nr:ParB/RepB/Spo0J family partition protein [Deinococcus aquiradiocola]GGJ68302.1 chromosome partitioning protein ParB [Deinococcus aquiradiocola]